MIVEIVYMHPFRFSGLSLVIKLDVNDSGLEPSRRGMIGIDTVINLRLFSGFPLRQDPV